VVLSSRTPPAYGKGKKLSRYDNGGQKVFSSHCNGSERPESRRCAAVEVGPKSRGIVWALEPEHASSFYSNRQGAVRRLPKGNMFICPVFNPPPAVFNPPPRGKQFFYISSESCPTATLSTFSPISFHSLASL